MSNWTLIQFMKNMENLMTWSTCKALIKEDLDRLSSRRCKLISYLISNASFKITFWYRILSFLKNRKGLYSFFYYIVYMIYKHYQYLTGIQLPVDTIVDGGVLFPHFSCIVIAGNCEIGKRCTIFHGVTIGSIRGGAKGGVPKIGDNVVLSTGAKVIGNVKIGNNVIVGAGAVVVSDIPDDSVVVGNPAKIINSNGKQHVNYYI